MTIHSLLTNRAARWGQPNGVREPAQHLAAPEGWLQEVEEIVFRRYTIMHDEADEVD